MMSKRKYFLILLLCCTLLGNLTACSIFSPIKEEPDKIYNLISVSTHRYPHKKTATTLLVTQPVAVAGYQNEEMIYVDLQDPYQLKSFAHHRWTASPAMMLLPLLVESLNNTQAFHAVIAPPVHSFTDRRLDVRLLSLQQEFFARDQSQVSIAIQATLTDNTSNKVISSQHFSVIVPAKMANPASGVEATNRAVKLILERIVSFCVK